MSRDVFISHHTSTCLPITQAICSELESRGISCWYAPRDTKNIYAEDIMDAIHAARVFIVILNREASLSEDVLNEIQIAFDRIRDGEPLAILPFCLTTQDQIGKSARYYLSRRNYIDGLTGNRSDQISYLADCAEAFLKGTDPPQYKVTFPAISEESEWIEIPESLPDVIVTLNGRLQFDIRKEHLFGRDDILELIVPGSIKIKSLHYKIGTDPTETLYGRNLCMVRIPDSYAGTGKFSFQVSYVTENGTQKPWEIYTLRMSDLAPLCVSLNGNLAKTGENIRIEEDRRFRIWLENEEPVTLYWKFGKAEMRKMPFSGACILPIPEEYLNKKGDYCSLQLCYVNNEGKQSPWQEYMIFA
jgi:hypothetical protein